MKNEEIKKIIEKKIPIISNRKIKVKKIDWDMDLTRDVGLDSVHFIRLITDLEKHFSIEIDLADIEIDRITNITYLVEYIESKTRATDQTPVV